MFVDKIISEWFCKMLFCNLLSACSPDKMLLPALGRSANFVEFGSGASLDCLSRCILQMPISRQKGLGLFGSIVIIKDPALSLMHLQASVGFVWFLQWLSTQVLSSSHIHYLFMNAQPLSHSAFRERGK